VIDDALPAACATVPAVLPSQFGLLSNTGRSSDSQAPPAACLLATEALAPPAMARISRLRRLVTAAGPSRNRTGVPCLPVARSSCGGPPESLNDNVAGRCPVSIERGAVRPTGKHQHGRSSRVKLCRSGEQNARNSEGCAGGDRTGRTGEIPVTFYPTRSRKSCSEKYLDALKPLSLIRR